VRQQPCCLQVRSSSAAAKRSFFKKGLTTAEVDEAEHVPDAPAAGAPPAAAPVASAPAEWAKQPGSPARQQQPSGQVVQIGSATASSSWHGTGLWSCSTCLALPLSQATAELTSTQQPLEWTPVSCASIYLPCMAADRDDRQSCWLVAPHSSQTCKGRGGIGFPQQAQSCCMTALMPLVG